jgi:hypothetical protein
LISACGRHTNSAKANGRRSRRLIPQAQSLIGALFLEVPNVYD